MLVINRKLGERIKIGPDVWIEVTRINNNQVRLGISAPRNIEVFREELLPDDEKYIATAGGK